MPGVEDSIPKRLEPTFITDDRVTARCSSCDAESMHPDTWRSIASTAIEMVETPCYVFVAGAIKEALGELRCEDAPVRRRQWLSLKTQPVKPLIELWRDWGLDIEVVSECELHAALSAGLSGERILVNGVGKQRWLHGYPVERLNVHFDSLAEVHALREAASRLHWQVGLRCLVPNQYDPEQPEVHDQFGMTPEEIVSATRCLKSAAVDVAGLHFHIGANVRRADEYITALRHVAAVCELADLHPKYVDIGGGLPVDGERPIDARAGRATPFDISRFTDMLSNLREFVPGIDEVWLENGRFITARSGALAVRVIDRKDRHDRAYVICDGGRINHARLSAVQVHDILLHPERSGPSRPTVVCGPTSAGLDKLGVWQLPESLRPGDVILWLNAGAYHIQLETRFSAGVAPVVWFDEAAVPHVARKRETPQQWWGIWT